MKGNVDFDMPDQLDQHHLAIENAIFDTALEIKDGELRELYLQKTFQGDPDGLERMRNLLSAVGESAAYFLQSRVERAELAEDLMREIGPVNLSQPEPDPDAEVEGTVIDRYVLLKRIGEGGCGVVYEARQDGMRRTVALKIIRLGMDSESVVKRFDAERHALELMDHPNIARVVDAGRTPVGRPYFVMELVRGQKITDYFRLEKPDLRAKLQIFLQVCQAIQHAHQKGIVHRDIKPSNILIESHDGVVLPKVIDFGIAKATENPVRDRGELTTLGQFLGTPAYMSPEQIDMGGIDIDTRSDIYSLGTLLYELLSGRPPFDSVELTKSGMSELRRILLEVDPPIPSAVAESGVSASLKGELDWIVVKAMEKDRNRRYQTVYSLAMDIRRYLTNEPVLARRPRKLYLMRKFFLRNQVACISGIMVAISLVVGMGGATVMYLKERNALAVQARLKEEADRARFVETHLRQQAQARANVSRVAILLSEGKIREADLLLQENPLDTIEPSKEAADVFRSVGGWNAVYGRWNQALACFELMNQANRLEDPQRTVQGLDLLMTGPTYLEAGDIDGYKNFRTEALSRYLPTRNSLQAEHLLKVCLLLPVDQQILEKLAAPADLCRLGTDKVSGQNRLPEWNALSAALYCYRADQLDECLKLAYRSLEFKDPAGTREAAVRCLLALALERKARHPEAREQLQIVHRMLRDASNPSDPVDSPTNGHWFAWSVARILCREADGLIDL
ncbi:serine/threonine protein kinase [Luteolibacter pohnpeiensis]|uniref:Serine/threonine protein kinase n=1 Tax=Luteolibacter pohnpeiensis TaxID=454153 RepID=A0A934VVU9_9BACT|nr:serine/threonine-protein kinase [Luteolibacter pohnpeiensis]MBK1882143.1 serine/threonine protein kinase [Luteolibacter pohnpeiensis]